MSEDKLKPMYDALNKRTGTGKLNPFFNSGFKAGWKAALEYARGQQEPVKGVVLSSDGPSLVKRGTERDYIARNGGSLLYTTPPAQPTYAEQCQAEGWLAVSKTLDEVMPGWADKADSGMEAACTAIRELAQSVQLAEQQEPVEWPHKMGCRANAFGSCNMGCEPLAQPVQQAVAINEQLLSQLKQAVIFIGASFNKSPEIILADMKAAIAAAEAANGGV